MKIKISKSQRQLHDKVVRRVKWSGLTFLVLGTATFIATSMSDSMSNHVQFVEA
jgi:hypothetical protein